MESRGSVEDARPPRPVPGARQSVLIHKFPEWSSTMANTVSEIKPLLRVNRVSEPFRKRTSPPPRVPSHSVPDAS